MRVVGGKWIRGWFLGCVRIYQGILLSIDLRWLLDFIMIVIFKFNTIAIVYTACYCQVFIFVTIISLFLNLLFNQYFTCLFLIFLIIYFSTISQIIVHRSFLFIDISQSIIPFAIQTITIFFRVTKTIKIKLILLSFRV